MARTLTAAEQSTGQPKRWNLTYRAGNVHISVILGLFGGETILKVLVTGASGFTGSHLARLLVEGGHEVRALVRPESSLELLEGVDVERAEGDLTDAEALRRAVSGVEKVFHLAAVYREAKLSDRVYREVNVEGTRKLAEAALAEAALAEGASFLYCSTGGVHGDVEPPASEEAPYNPGDVYQETKVEAEKLLLAMHRERGLPVVLLRPIGIYGPGDRRFLKLFKGVARRRFPMIGSGEVFYHLTYVEDVARGFLRAAETPEAVGEAYILAGSRYTTVRELVALIAEKAGVEPPRFHWPARPLYWAAALCEDVCRPLGLEPPLHRRRLDFFLKQRAFEIGKARRGLGWEPRVDLEEGIERTFAWYRSAGWL